MEILGVDDGVKGLVSATFDLATAASDAPNCGPPASIIQKDDRDAPRNGVATVISGRRIVAAQRGRVTQLRATAKDATEAEALLAQYERSLAIFEDDLARLERGVSPA